MTQKDIDLFNHLTYLRHKFDVMVLERDLCVVTDFVDWVIDQDLIDKILATHRLNRIIKRQTLKVSYNNLLNGYRNT